MFLNDAFDQEFDRLRRPERPIPSGKIPAAQVWIWGLSLLLAGMLTVATCGFSAAICGVILAFFIVLYDFTHKAFIESPWLMASCRFWVYIIAGATGVHGLNGFAIFGGAALALYVAGLSYVARQESTRGRIPWWPPALLAAPIVLAWMINAGAYRVPVAFVAFILLAWIARCVRSIFIGGSINAGWIVSNLLAGIVLVDWLAVAPLIPTWTGALVFMVLLALTKWMQKFVPAT